MLTASPLFLILAYSHILSFVRIALTYPLHQQSLYKDSIHVPLLFALPEQHKKSIVEDIVESIDVLPTILDLWNIKPKASLPFHLDGKSLLPFITDEEGSKLSDLRSKDYVKSEYHGGMQLNDPLQSLPGIRTAPPYWARNVSMFSIRTRNYSYVAYFTVTCKCTGLHLNDEALFDLTHDRTEAINVAYDTKYDSTRRAMLSRVRVSCCCTIKFLWRTTT